MIPRHGRVLACVVMAASLAVPVAGKDLGANLQGKWLLDKVALFEASAPPFYKMATPEKQKELREDMLKDMPDSVVEFTAGALTMKMGDKTSTATYKVTKSEGQTVWFDTFSTDAKSGKPLTDKAGKPVVDQMTGNFVGADTLKLTGTGGAPQMVLKRIK